jgi:H+/Cl- antiporter ClcA
MIRRIWLLEFLVLAGIRTTCTAFHVRQSWMYHFTVTTIQQQDLPLSLQSRQLKSKRCVVSLTKVWDKSRSIKFHDKQFRLNAIPDTSKTITTTDRTINDSINRETNDDNDCCIAVDYTNDDNTTASTTTTTKARILTAEPSSTIDTISSSRSVRNHHNQNDSSTIDRNSIPTTMTNINGSVFRLQYAAYDMICAGIVGIVTGIVVAYFKLSIESVRVYTYSLNILDYLHNEIGAILIPVLGGILVGVLIRLGPFSPGLRGTVSQNENVLPDTSTDDKLLQSNGKDHHPLYRHPILNRIRQQIPLLRKSTAAICTLGTGCSLGPEGPCVELGMGISRSCMDLFHQRPIQLKSTNPIQDDIMTRSTWNRILLSCGAAAGVSAGFDAPVAGVFFVLEVMQSAFTDITVEQRRQLLKDGTENTNNNPITNELSIETNNLPNSSGLFSSSSTLFPVLLSSVLSALCARSILGDHLTFNVAHTDALSSSPLIELPIYLLLGSICGIVAFLFSQSAKVSRSFFKGEIGNDIVRNMMQSLSPTQKPIIGGLFCGITALFFPQILFFGYETLNSLLSNTVTVPTTVLLSLLFVKAIATAVSIGSGLVGGTLAPALFMGGVTGASFHNIMSDLYQFAAIHVNDMTHIPLVDTFLSEKMVVLADLPDYAMVGSASVLAALFRAPLTASLLLFELSRDYDVILPIIASAGVGSVVADILEDAFLMKPEEVCDSSSNERYKLRKARRDQDSASWGDLSDKDDHDEPTHIEQQQ